jgi:hypothetical protein
MSQDTSIATGPISVSTALTRAPLRESCPPATPKPTTGSSQQQRARRDATVQTVVFSSARAKVGC